VLRTSKLVSLPIFRFLFEGIEMLRVLVNNRDLQDSDVIPAGSTVFDLRAESIIGDAEDIYMFGGARRVQR